MPGHQCGSPPGTSDFLPRGVPSPCIRITLRSPVSPPAPRAHCQGGPLIQGAATSACSPQRSGPPQVASQHANTDKTDRKRCKPGILKEWEPQSVPLSTCKTPKEASHPNRAPVTPPSLWGILQPPLPHQSSCSVAPQTPDTGSPGWACCLGRGFLHFLLHWWMSLISVNRGQACLNTNGSLEGGCDHSEINALSQSCYKMYVLTRGTFCCVTECRTISMGQGQEVHARKLIQMSMQQVRGRGQALLRQHFRGCVSGRGPAQDHRSAGEAVCLRPSPFPLRLCVNLWLPVTLQPRASLLLTSPQKACFVFRGVSSILVSLILFGQFGIPAGPYGYTSSS